MQLNLRSTRFTLIPDNLVEDKGGSRIVEAMFSSVVDLSNPQYNFAERIHPSRGIAYELILAGKFHEITIPDQSAAGGKGKLKLHPTVEFQLNDPQGKCVSRSFMEVLSLHQELALKGIGGNVVATHRLSGFDRNGEPVVRVLKNGGYLLLLSNFPPVAPPAENPNFDKLDHFEEAITTAVGNGIQWDDRETFWIPSPDATCLERIATFFANYWNA